MRISTIILTLLLCKGIYAKELKEYSLNEYNKGTYDFSEVIGKKRLVINFWASWCTPCIEELPLLHALQRKYKDKDVEFIAVNSGEKEKKIKKFLKRYPFEYKILMDPEKSVAALYGIESLPYTLVLDMEGKVIFKDIRPPNTLK